jgi:putative transposase
MIALDDPHHVTQCGNRRQQAFFCDNDYKRYIGLMLHGVKSRKERYGHIL